MMQLVHITLDPSGCEGTDEYENQCWPGRSRTECCECGSTSPSRPRHGWWVDWTGDALFFCDDCVRTHLPLEVAG